MNVAAIVDDTIARFRTRFTLAWEKESAGDR